MNIAYCTAVAPGNCCISELPECSTMVANMGKFDHLPPGAMSAFWGRPAGDDWNLNCHRGCDGRQLAFRYDVPHWKYKAPTGYRESIHGASYIQCPSKTIATADATGLGWLGVLLGFCTKAGRERRSVSVEAGDGVVKKPTWVYPDILEVNGTNYTDGRRGDMVYRDLVGRKLDLNLLR